MTDRRMQIAQALEAVETRIADAALSAGRSRDSITLIVVTKNYPVSDVLILKDLGVENFGENRDQEGREKANLVKGTWHFQGQVQSNKIASIARWADVLHSIDEVRHIRKLETSLTASRCVSVFLQVSLDGQVGRGGANPEELSTLAEAVLACPHLILQGLMAVAPLEEDPDRAFARLAQIHADFRRNFPMATSLSAGMSGDFEKAIAHGATHVRIGSSILGVRSYQR